MTDQFVAEIRIFGFNFAPTGWASCNGQLLPISQNTALFSLLGTTYGGDGKSTFALPNLQDSVPVGEGNGPGLTSRFLGETDGVETVTLLQSEMPAHPHSLNASTGATDEEGQKSPQNAAPGVMANTAKLYGPLNNDAQLKTLAVTALAPTGAGLPHNNAMPSLTFQFCIALQGIFPAPYVIRPRAAPDRVITSLRPATADDRPFLLDLYATTRAAELERVPWPPEQKDAFVRQQFEAQDAFYRNHYEGVSFDVVVVDGVDVGRLYVARTAREVRVIDIDDPSRARGRGTGTALLRQLLDDAATTGRPVTISVERLNRAQHLYRRLGFQETATDDVYIAMEWRPPPSS